MVRLASGPSLLAVLGLAGFAMAQEGLVVDPWKRAVAAVTGNTSTPPPAAERTLSRPIGVASFPIEEPRPRVNVVPIGPPLAFANDASGVVPLGPATHDEVFDPWASSAVGRGASRLVAARSAHRDWAFEINEIIDPWSKGPLAAVTDPLIVDPWAR